MTPSDIKRIVAIARGEDHPHWAELSAKDRNKAELGVRWVLAAGYVILPTAEVDAMDEAMKLLSDSLLDYSPVSGEYHRKRVIEFIEQRRALKGEKP